MSWTIYYFISGSENHLLDLAMAVSTAGHRTEKGAAAIYLVSRPAIAIDYRKYANVFPETGHDEKVIKPVGPSP
jgi:hypothetical protein